MSTATEVNNKPSEEFVVFGEEPLSKDDKTSPKPEPALSLDTQIDPEQQVNRTDSFPRTLPLPASSVLSPTSAPSDKDLIPPISKESGPEDLVSPPEGNPDKSAMFLQSGNISTAATTSVEYDGGSSTPLAELAGTDFDHAVAVRRRGASVVGEEISENLEDLKAEDSAEPVQETKKPASTPLSEEALLARKTDPAVVAALPLTPSAEDFQVARSHEGSNFNPEYPTETKVVS